MRCAQSSSRMPPSHVGTTACLIVLGWVLVRWSFSFRPRGTTRPPFARRHRDQTVVGSTCVPAMARSFQLCGPTHLCDRQVAFLKGDYRATSYDAWSVMGPVLSALRSAAVTWVRPPTNVLLNRSGLIQLSTLRAAPIRASVERGR